MVEEDGKKEMAAKKEITEKENDGEREDSKDSKRKTAKNTMCEWILQRGRLKEGDQKSASLENDDDNDANVRKKEGKKKKQEHGADDGAGRRTTTMETRSNSSAANFCALRPSRSTPAARLPRGFLQGTWPQ